MKSFKNIIFEYNYNESINFKQFYRNNINNMNSMFKGCSSLLELNFNSFNRDNATDISYTFSGYESLKKINIQNFNTNNVTDMICMFSGCQSLNELNISGFSMNKVNKTEHMFVCCYSLKELKFLILITILLICLLFIIKKVDFLGIVNLEGIENMFYNCRAIRRFKYFKF